MTTKYRLERISEKIQNVRLDEGDARTVQNIGETIFQIEDRGEKTDIYVNPKYSNVFKIESKNLVINGELFTLLKRGRVTFTKLSGPKDSRFSEVNKLDIRNCGN